MDLFTLFEKGSLFGENKPAETVSVNNQDMEELVKRLNKASDDYYNGTESISDREYDELFDRLLAMEKETGVVLPDSPTQRVGAEAVSKLEKVQHEYPALSLDKTKDPAELIKWMDGRKAVLSWKMDGLTVVLTYDDGKLTDAVTRGNGYIGERIMHNVPHFDGIPVRIPEKGHVVVRGEAVMHYSEFERINENREEDEDDYKNPRNLASGTVRALDSSVCEERKITFYAFQFVTGYKDNSFGGSLMSLKAMALTQWNGCIQMRTVWKTILHISKAVSVMWIFRLTDLCLCMMIRHMGCHLAVHRTIPVTEWHLSGRMK